MNISPEQLGKEVVKEIITLSESTGDPVVDDFVDFVCELLEIKSRPLIEIKDEPMLGEQPSFGGYHPTDKSIRVCFGKRHKMDALRTLAHELVHYKQDEDGILKYNEDGDTGSEVENEANTKAGIIMREYGKIHPELY